MAFPSSCYKTGGSSSNSLLPTGPFPSSCNNLVVNVRRREGVSASPSNNCVDDWQHSVSGLYFKVHFPEESSISISNGDESGRPTA